jgi:hypothetical protein
MDNQHRKITGYRELSEAEIATMNEIKAKGKELEALIEMAHNAGGDPRAIAIAKTELQTGIMWLTRAVAKPEFF